MTAPNAGVELPTQSHNPSPVVPNGKLLYWSVRREIWENRSIYIGPLVVAAVVLFGFMISTFTLSSRINSVLSKDPAKQRETVTMPFSVIAALLMLTAFVVAFFYCLDALNSERRDRSILFWKSLPVSDRLTVLSKASISLLVLPLFIFMLALVAQAIMLWMSTVVLLGNGRALATLWKHVQFFQSSLGFLYGLITIALWHAPLYSWLLLVSAWARRATFLWAVFPPLMVAVFERVAFGTSYFGKFLGYRVAGSFERAFEFPPKGTKVAVDPLAYLTPGKFLLTPGLWLGLVCAALFLAAAIRLRRNREPN